MSWIWKFSNQIYLWICIKSTNRQLSNLNIYYGFNVLRTNELKKTGVDKIANALSSNLDTSQLKSFKLSVRYFNLLIKYETIWIKRIHLLTILVEIRVLKWKIILLELNINHIKFNSTQFDSIIIIGLFYFTL